MKKTSGQIEEYVYGLITDSSLSADIRGTIYRDNLRPLNSETEDLVIQRAIGTANQVQIGVVNINVYVPNILSNSVSTKDVDRCVEIEILMNSFVESLTDSNYDFSLDEMIVTEKVEGIEQYFVNTRLKYRTI